MMIKMRSIKLIKNKTMTEDCSQYPVTGDTAALTTQRGTRAGGKDGRNGDPAGRSCLRWPITVRGVETITDRKQNLWFSLAFLKRASGVWLARAECIVSWDGSGGDGGMAPTPSCLVWVASERKDEAGGPPGGPDGGSAVAMGPPSGEGLILRVVHPCRLCNYQREREKSLQQFPQMYVEPFLLGLIHISKF
ncbi:hypothetical protein SRHO_G00029290 [Serrasalmus rhombeus]